MKKTVLTVLMLLVLVLTASSFATVGDIWNARNEWVDGLNQSTNPNLPWRYRHGDGSLLLWNPAGQWDRPAGYTKTLPPDPAQEGLLFVAPGAPDFEGHGPWQMEWESPVSGRVKATGYVYGQVDPGRLTEWKILKNGSTVASGFCVYDCVSNVSLLGPNNKAYFDVEVDVVIGDTVALLAGPLGWGQVPGPCAPNGPAPAPQWCAGSLQIEQIPQQGSGLTWDAKTDWIQGAQPQDPNSIWTYRHGGSGTYGQLLVWKAGGQWDAPACYALSATENFEGLLFGVGTGSVPDMDPIDVGGHGPWVLRWKSPIDGIVEIDGYIYGTIDYNRLTVWQLIKNKGQVDEEVLTDGTIPYNCAINRALMGPSNKTYFNGGSGSYCGNWATVSVGDTIDLFAGPSGWGGATPCTTGPAPAPQWCAAAMTVRERAEMCDPNATVSLTMVIDSPVPLPAGTVHPEGTVTDIPRNSSYSISASRVVDCPNVWEFAEWQGTGISNPLIPSTSVLMDADKTITVVYVDGRACGDECRPIMQMDFNQDCIVNITDFSAFALQWLECNQPDCQ